MSKKLEFEIAMRLKINILIIFTKRKEANAKRRIFILFLAFRLGVERLRIRRK